MLAIIKDNRIQLINTFRICSIILLSICGILFCIAFLNKQFPEIKLFIAILLVAGIFFPFFIICIGFLIFINDTKRYKKLFNENQIQMLKALGYSKKITNENSKWVFKEEIYSKVKDGFKIQILLKNEFVVFICNAFNERPNKENLKYFKQKIKRIEIHDNLLHGYLIEIKTKDFDKIDLNLIDAKMNALIELLSEYNFTPLK